MTLGRSNKRLKERSLWRCQRKILGLFHEGGINKKQTVAKKSLCWNGNSATEVRIKTYMAN